MKISEKAESLKENLNRTYKRWEELEEICDRYKIHYIPDIPEKILAAEASGLAVTGSDGHWRRAVRVEYKGDLRGHLR